MQLYALEPLFRICLLKKTFLSADYLKISRDIADKYMENLKQASGES